VKAEELGAEEQLPLFLPTPSFMISFVLLFVISLVFTYSFLRQAWPGKLDKKNASMIKLKEPDSSGS